MDIRIVNTCDSNCLYCLEQSLRQKDYFLDIQSIFKSLKKSKNKNVLSFYGWNPLLHPELEKIILWSHNYGFENISILTNTLWLSKSKLEKFIKNGLTGMSFYFHSFSTQQHNIAVQSWISLKKLLDNIKIIQKSGLSYKAIIHINGNNISDIQKNIIILYTYFWVRKFDFINYFPFDRPYDVYKDMLEYDIYENRENIDKILKIINKLNSEVKFLKFSKDFFWDNTQYYFKKEGILDQVWSEDKERLRQRTPFCYTEKRCESCFIKDICDFYKL